MDGLMIYQCVMIIIRLCTLGAIPGITILGMILLAYIIKKVGKL